jgi:hypothetical protein
MITFSKTNGAEQFTVKSTLTLAIAIGVITAQRNNAASASALL